MKILINLKRLKVPKHRKFLLETKLVTKRRNLSVSLIRPWSKKTSICIMTLEGQMITTQSGWVINLSQMEYIGFTIANKEVCNVVQRTMSQANILPIQIIIAHKTLQPLRCFVTKIYYL